MAQFLLDFRRANFKNSLIAPRDIFRPQRLELNINGQTTHRCTELKPEQ
jgi:hypothetical protein